MKFYTYKYGFNFWNKIKVMKLSAIYGSCFIVWFFKNGKEHNNKNASYVDKNAKSFYLNGNYYGNHNDLTKESWQRFIKMQVFL